MNTTSEVPGSPRSSSYALLAFSQALAFPIIVGNSIALAAYGRNAFLHALIYYIFNVSLVVSDLLVGAVSPLFISRISRFVCWRFICVLM